MATIKKQTIQIKEKIVSEREGGLEPGGFPYLPLKEVPFRYRPNAIIMQIKKRKSFSIAK